MASITFAVDDTLKKEITTFSWLNLSELVRQELLRRQILLNKLNSKEEQELMKWSVELGRKAKKDSFRRVLSELSPEEREELLKNITPEKKKNLEEV